MTIEHAIVFLEDHERTIDLSHNLAFHTAIHLGIEALKRIERCRRDTDCPAAFQLPGETKE